MPGRAPVLLNGVAGVSFAVWAPSATRVSVVGSFNQWDGRRTPMRLRQECGIWETFVPALAAGDLYKFEVHTQRGDRLLKSDPYAFAAQMRPDTASVVQALPPENPWRPTRAKANAMDQPIRSTRCIWAPGARTTAGAGKVTANWLRAWCPTPVEMGFTHLELLPISEHPFDGSWGYQPWACYAPTSRFGSPTTLKFFVAGGPARPAWA